MSEVININPNIEVLGIYDGALTAILHKNKICGHEFLTSPSSVLQGVKCPICNRNAGISRDEYIEKLKIEKPNIILLGDYINAKTKTKHKCLICNAEWSSIPDNVLKCKYSCPECAKVEQAKNETKSHDLYVKELEIKNPNLEVIGEYINNNTKIKHRCKQCGDVFDITPNGALAGRGCSLCCNPPQKIGQAPEYRNSIWNSKYKDICDKYMTEEQMKSIMPHSIKKILVKCPDCGREKYITPYNLISNGLGCICGDGISYPNKFMYNILQQLHVNFIPEYSPLWAQKCRYDIYVEKYNLIIENHGIQHYEDRRNNEKHKTLEEEQENDRRKQEIAMQNGISNYVVIDCRKSSVEWIKENVLKSNLIQILNFNEQDINWTCVDIYASSNLIKEAAKLLNDGNSVAKIANILNVSDTTVRTWVKKGTKFGWCNYKTPTEIMMERVEQIKEYLKFHPDANMKTVSTELNIPYHNVADYHKRFKLFQYLLY